MILNRSVKAFQRENQEAEIGVCPKKSLVFAVLLLNLSLFSAIIHYLASWNIIFTNREYTHLFLVYSPCLYIFVHFYFKALPYFVTHLCHLIFRTYFCVCSRMEEWKTPNSKNSLAKLSVQTFSFSIWKHSVCF